MVEHAFGTSLASYRLPDGRVGFANRSAPRLRARITNHVEAVVGLDSLGEPQHTGLTSAADPQPTPACAQQLSTAATDYPGSVLFGANDVAHAYGFDKLYAAGDLGQGTTVALVEFAPFDAGDIATFQACYGTSAAVNALAVDGGAGQPTPNGPLAPDEVEGDLDIETMIGLAPGATIDVYEAPSNAATGALDAFAAAIANPAVSVISFSFGACESLLDPAQETAEATLF